MLRAGGPDSWGADIPYSSRPPTRASPAGGRSAPEKRNSPERARAQKPSISWAERPCGRAAVAQSVWWNARGVTLRRACAVAQITIAAGECVANDGPGVDYLRRAGIAQVNLIWQECLRRCQDEVDT